MRFGPFEIERPLGRGGMAETFVARYQTTQGFERTVCLKRILAEHAVSAEFVRAFQEEAKLAMRLLHPHIAQVYDFGEVEGSWWMSLELVGGGDLRTLLKELGQPMPVDLALLLAIDLASALEYAHGLVVDGHEANLVHRDVSPSNVLIDEQGNFKLVDFGIAKSSLSGSDTTTGKVKGKASYMAPEQGLGRKVDRRADLWALGVVLFEALAGRRPFEAATDLATILRVTQGERPTLASLAPHVPDDVAAIVERLLSVDLDARFQSASEVIEALEHRPPPPTARRRLAAIIRKIQTGEVRSDLPPAATPEGTLAITSLALGAEEGEPVPSAPDDPTRTRTVFDAQLERSIAGGAFEPTQRQDSLAPRVVVSPALSPQRLEVTETQARFRVLPAIAIVGAAGLVVGGVVAAGVVLDLGVPGAASEPRDGHDVAAVASAPDAARASEDPVLDAANRDEVIREEAIPDAFSPDAFSPDAFSPDAFDWDAGSQDPHSSPDRAPVASPREGRIEVIVVPWGRVEIDGVDVGRAPYRGTLPTGTHRVEGVAGDARRTRSVRVTGRGVTHVSISVE